MCVLVVGPVYIVTALPVVKGLYTWSDIVIGVQ